MKTCNRCGEQKEEILFVVRKKNKSGYGSTCKSCVAEYMRDYYKNNPDKAAINRSKQKLRDAGRDRFTRHGITIGQYDDMVSKYNGKCWSCMERPATHIDHDHKCCSKTYSCGSCIRGVLCSQCNTALGLLQDRVDLINNLAEYARQSS